MAGAASELDDALEVAQGDAAVAQQEASTTSALCAQVDYTPSTLQPTPFPPQTNTRSLSLSGRWQAPGGRGADLVG